MKSTLRQTTRFRPRPPPADISPPPSAGSSTIRAADTREVTTFPPRLPAARVSPPSSASSSSPPASAPGSVSRELKNEFDSLRVKFEKFEKEERERHERELEKEGKKTEELQRQKADSERKSKQFEMRLKELERDVQMRQREIENLKAGAERKEDETLQKLQKEIETLQERNKERDLAQKILAMSSRVSHGENPYRSYPRDSPLCDYEIYHQRIYFEFEIKPFKELLPPKEFQACEIYFAPIYPWEIERGNESKKTLNIAGFPRTEWRILREERDKLLTLV